MYSGYEIGFDLRLKVSLLDRSMSKNVIILGVDMSSFVYTDDKKKDILILGKGLRQGLDDTTLTAESQYQLIFQDQMKHFCLSLSHNVIMRATVLYLLMLQKYISSKLKILKQKHIPFASEIF